MSVEVVSPPKYLVAIVGGAVAGSEATRILTDHGVGVVVFEQNARPYGKIEDGLPRWHDKQKPKEYEKINAPLHHPLVHFVPSTKIGRDLSFADLKDWGFNYILLANGAWRDRPLEIEGIDDSIDKGFYYQNPFIHWFNHYTETNFRGLSCEVCEDAMVIGGGLASIDVAKILMIETISQALGKKGIVIDPIEIEHKSCKKVLEENGLTLEKLGVTPCTLYYRRRACDMPVASFKPGASEEEKKKTQQTREHLLNIATEKYLFRFQGNSLPLDKIVENGRLVGLRFIKTEIKDDRVIKLPNTEFTVRSPLTISSIGSVPEPIEGIPMKGEFYTWKNWDLGELDSHHNVFGLGNVVTGKGNIVVSRKHGQKVAEYLIHEKLKITPPLTPDQYKKVLEKIQARQKIVGYDGDFSSWMKKAVPHEP